MQLFDAKITRADLTYQDTQAIYCADWLFSDGSIHVDILQASAPYCLFMLYTALLSKGIHSHGLNSYYMCRWH